MPQPAGTRTVLVAHPSADLYGSDRVLLETVAGLVTSGWRVVVALPADGPLAPLVTDRGAEVVICGTPVLRKSLLRPRGLLRLARDLARGLVDGVRLVRSLRPSVVLVNTVTIPGWLLVASLTRRPSLCHVHEAEGSASPLVRRLLAAPLLLTDRIAINSRFSLDVLVGAVPRLRARTTLVLNAVPGPPARVPARTSPGAPVRLLYVGRLSPRKGVDVAVGAALELRARGREVELTVVGAVFPGYEWYADELRAQVAAAGADDVVHLAGFRPVVWPSLAEADVALVPSRVDEPFGNTAVEAVLAGRPAVLSATSGLLEAGAGYASVRTVAPGDPAAIADAVDDLLAHWADLPLDADTALARERHDPLAYQARMTALVEEVAAR